MILIIESQITSLRKFFYACVDVFKIPCINILLLPINDWIRSRMGLFSKWEIKSAATHKVKNIKKDYRNASCISKIRLSSYFSFYPDCLALVFLPLILRWWLEDKWNWLPWDYFHHLYLGLYHFPTLEFINFNFLYPSIFLWQEILSAYDSNSLKKKPGNENNLSDCAIPWWVLVWFFLPP